MSFNLSLQAEGKVAFGENPVFCACRPACHDSYLYRFVLGPFLETVALFQVYVYFNIFCQHIVHVDWVVFYNHDIKSLRCSSSDTIGYLHRLVLVASAVIRVLFLCIRICNQQSGDCWEILRLSSHPCFPQFNLLNVLSIVAVNSLGDMVSPCLTPLLILIASLSLCWCTITELCIYTFLRIPMYTSSIPCSCNDVNIALVCTELNAFSQSTNET